MIINKEVLLLKAQDNENDKYETLLRTNGFRIKHLQILDFQYINLSLLLEKLSHPNLYNGIIFTSPRAVIATKLSLKDAKLDEKWFGKHNFTVGESTYHLVEKELNIVSKGKESGNANNLVDLIIEEHGKENFSKFLFPCGNLKKEILSNRLQESKIDLDAVTVYETIQYLKILENFKTVTDNLQNIPEYFVYFSPSGVKYTTNIFKNLGIDFDKLKLIAIGPSTEEALESANLTVYSTAKKPTENELLNCILKEY